MDPLTVFGLVSVSARLLCYAPDPRESAYVLGFALASAAGAAYPLLAGAWPFTVIEVVWGFVALRRFIERRATDRRRKA